MKNLKQNFMRLHAATPWSIIRLDDAISEFFKLEASPVKDQSLQQKGRKREKEKAKKKIEKPKNEDIGTFSSKI